MVKVNEPPFCPDAAPPARGVQFAASEGQTLTSYARTVTPCFVPMSGREGPAGAANHLLGALSSFQRRGPSAVRAARVAYV